MYKLLTAFLRSKKGVELAASTMVILIISIVIFGYSMYFLFDMWKNIDVIKKDIDVQTQKQIDLLLRDPRVKVAIPNPTQNIFSGETAKFWIGVKNIGAAPANFKIETKFSKAGSSDAKTEFTPSTDPNLWTGNLKEVDLEDVPAKQQRETFVMIQPDTQQQGTYTFTVHVTKDGADYGTYPINVVIS